MMFLHFPIWQGYAFENRDKISLSLRSIKCEDMDRARQFALTLAAQIVDFLFYIFSDFFFLLYNLNFRFYFHLYCCCLESRK